MVRVKQTSRKSTAAKRPLIPKEIAEYRAATGSTVTGPPTDEEYKLADQHYELVKRRDRYKADAGDRFWDVTLESLYALVFRSATLAELAGEWEIFGSHEAVRDSEAESVLEAAGHLSIGDNGAGVIDIHQQPYNGPLSGAFSIEFYKSDDCPWKRRSAGETKGFIEDARDWAFFEFDSVEGVSLRWDARGRGPKTKFDEGGSYVDDDMRVGQDWDMAGKLACGVVHEDVPSMRLLEGDLVVAEMCEMSLHLLFARRRDAPVPFPRADFVSVALKDRALSAALTRIRELESERDVVVDLTLDNDDNDDAPPAKRQTLRDLRDKDVDAKLKEVKQEKVVVEARLDETMTCVVCQDAPRSVLLSCAHACLCVACANQVTECPLCRQNITSRTSFILA